MVVRAEVSSANLVDLAVAIKYENDGQVMRKDLVRNLRAAVRPAAAEAKASILSAPSGGLKQPGGSMRSAIARQIKTQVSLTEKRAKVTVRVRNRNMPRGFKNPPKAWSLPGGWRHPVIGWDHERWVTQIGKPGWFDVPLRSHRVAYKAAIQEAMNDAADRIARKV